MNCNFVSAFSIGGGRCENVRKGLKEENRRHSVPGSKDYRL